MRVLEKYLPLILKWLLIVMFLIGICAAILNIGYVSPIYSIGVIVYNLWGMYFAWKNGKLTRQSTFSQLMAFAFFITSWQLILLYVYANKFDMVTLLLTIAFTFLFAITQFLDYRRRVKEKKEAEAKELAKKQARAERKAAKQKNKEEK